MKRLLMIAYHFPPLAGSSGVQRTLRFMQHLPAFGWQPLILTASKGAYVRTSDDLLQEISPDVVVRRAFALDAARHLSVRGHYWGATARPDRWASWRFDAVRQGLAMIRDYQPDAIWSTYPIATAHVVASILSKKSGLPWIADFRDPMAHDGYPSDTLTWEHYRRIEADAAAFARCMVFVTASAAQTYRRLYPAAAQRIHLVENGYDEESFKAAERQLPILEPAALQAPRKLVLLHSGIVYPSERDPTQLFVALARLRLAGDLKPSELIIRFRASGNEAHLRQLTEALGVREFIELCPEISYVDALSEMLTVDALLILQASNCNTQIPAKIYEYIRAARPVLGLTDPAGATAAAMHAAKMDDQAPLDDADAVARALMVFLNKVLNHQTTPPPLAVVIESSRRGRTEALAQVLNAACQIEEVPSELR